MSDFKHSCTCGRLQDDTVLIKRKDLAKLTQLVHSIRTTLPHIVNTDLLAGYRNQYSREEELSTASVELQSLATDRDHWKARFESSVADVDQLHKDRFENASRVQELTDQLAQQTEYCTSMGAACSTLLWRVSRTEDAVTAMLSGNKIEEFLDMVSATVDSYARIFVPDSGPVNGEGEETQFVLALCGIITNIAASPFGREFLMTKDSGRRLVDTFLAIVYDVPPKQCPRVKTLMLMAVYNVSINQKGLRHLRSKQSLVTQMSWVLQGETDTECRLNALRLVQSLLYDEQSTSVGLVHEAVEVLSTEFLRQLANDKCPDIKSVAVELMNILRDAAVEP